MALIVLREYRLFGEVLADHAEQKPDETAFSFRRADGSPEGVTYRLLREKANSVAAALTENPEENGNVLLLFPPGLEFIEGFLGCASAGLAAVPLSMPGRRQSFDAIRAIAQD